MIIRFSRTYSRGWHWWSSFDRAMAACAFVPEPVRSVACVPALRHAASAASTTQRRAWKRRRFVQSLSR